jgi:hypothetical protein
VFPIRERTGDIWMAEWRTGNFASRVFAFEGFPSQ